MRRLLPLLAFAILAGSCAPRSPPPPLPKDSPPKGPLPKAALTKAPLPKEWNIGFWLWHRGEAAPGPPVDVLYYHGGGIRHDRSLPYRVYGELPTELPPARAYWFVFRYDGPGIPPADLAIALSERVAKLQHEARRRGIQLVGIQLDIDSPTRSLPEYAAFLRHVKAALPLGLELSITTLLDWFRPSTAIAAVIDEVDEFVPQFYDLQNPKDDHPDSAIAAPFDAAKWNPVFQRFGRRFRIGISTFGRARFVSPTPIYINIRDAEPIHLALLPDFKASTSYTPARELVLRYEAQRKTTVAYTEFAPGGAIEFTLATPESIRTAVDQIRQLGGYSGGVIFFRWPVAYEPLAMPPKDVLRAAKREPDPSPPTQLRVVDGHCAAVSCVDLYLEDLPRLTPGPTPFQIHSTIPIDYFVPSERGPARLVGPTQVGFTLPPFCGRHRLFLGRAVTPQPATFTLRQNP